MHLQLDYLTFRPFLFFFIFPCEAICHTLTFINTLYRRNTTTKHHFAQLQSCHHEFKASMCYTVRPYLKLKSSSPFLKDLKFLLYSSLKFVSADMMPQAEKTTCYLVLHSLNTHASNILY